MPIFFLLSAFVLYRPFVDARVVGRPRTIPGLRDPALRPHRSRVLDGADPHRHRAGHGRGVHRELVGVLRPAPELPRVHPAWRVRGAGAFRCGVPVAWTLSVELLFYVFLPFFVLGMAWVGRRWRGPWLVPELLAVGLLSVSSLVIQWTVPTSDLHVWLFYSPFGRGWWFGLGLLLAALSVAIAPPGGARRRRLAPAAPGSPGGGGSCPLRARGGALRRLPGLPVPARHARVDHPVRGGRGHLRPRAASRGVRRRR
ncbi:MAG: hypothetical protein R2695_13775 [Acidimicrobiales bacterium]